ncbi:MAG: Smr/MutS family protein [Rickettsiales bacterium]
MKKPRTLTPEEEQLWQEANKHTKAKKAQPAPPPTGGRPGGGLAGTSSVTEPPPQPSPGRGGREKPPLALLPQRDAKRAFKPYGPIEATLDLHGLTKHEAYTKVQQFITRQQRAGKRHLAIITGKGRAGEAGVLRSNLPHWLNEPALRPLISAFAHAPAEKGGSGVTHVLVKRL